MPHPVIRTIIFSGNEEVQAMKKFVLLIIFPLLSTVFTAGGIEPVPVADNGSAELFFVPQKASADFLGRTKRRESNCRMAKPEPIGC